MIDDPADPADLALLDELRPRTRGDCEDGARPCPWVACKHHLLWERPEAWHSSKEGGALHSDSIVLRVLDRMPESCTLDAADRGPLVGEEVGKILSLSRERIRQIETLVLNPDAADFCKNEQRRHVARLRLSRLRVLLNGDGEP